MDIEDHHLRDRHPHRKEEERNVAIGKVSARERHFLGGHHVKVGGSVAVLVAGGILLMWALLPDVPQRCDRDVPIPEGASVHMVINKVEGRVIVVGDPHGCLEEFREMMRLLRLSHDDLVIVTGDVVNKGPRSVGLVRFIRKRPNIVSLRGNHEEWVLAALERARRGLSIPRSLHWALNLLPDDELWLRQRPFSVTLPQYKAIVVHAGVLPGVPVDRHPLEVLSKMRNIVTQFFVNIPTASGHHGVPWVELYEGPYHVFFGHDAARGLQLTPYATGVDTGCVYGGNLTAVDIASRKMYSVKAHRQYVAPAVNLSSRGSRHESYPFVVHWPK
eukprot:Sspe_Gene.19819::Locus_7242_Transcript_1_1_Confidence_1.000_Length_1165::g.19819::m.19819